MPFEQILSAGLGTAGAIYDIASQRGRAEQAYHRQKRLWDVQDEHQRQMAEFNQANAMEMWKATGPVGQIEQLKKAGLNPALIYGMGGAGGQTANTPQGQSANSGNAPMAPPTNAGGMGLMLAEQISLLKAQKENIQADTANKTADTANKPITGENIQANTALTKTNTELAQLDAKYKNATLEQSIANFANEASRIMAEARISMTKANITGASQEDQIKQIHQTLLKTITENAAINQQIKESAARVHKTDIEISQIIQNMYNSKEYLRLAMEGLGTTQNQNAFNNMMKSIEQETGLGEDIVKMIGGAGIGAGAKIPMERTSQTQGYTEQGGYFESKTHQR